jgi:SSS family solute:Na+ symporter
MAIPLLLFLGFFIAPYFFRTRIDTIPGFYEKRFDGRARTFMVVFAILTALLLHIGISLYAGAKIVKLFFGLDELVAIILIALLTTVYTVLGGLKAVAVTETIQSVLLLGGAVLITQLGGFQLPEAGVHTFSEFKNRLAPEALTMLRSPDSPSGGGIPWYAVLLGYPVLGVWYWCSDQTIVQRTLGARSERDARLGPMFTAVLKLMPVFFMVAPGTIAYILFKDKIMELGTGQTLPYMIQELAPVGLKGLIVAALLAALMSTVAAALNSTATLFSYDILKRMKPETSDKKMVFAGRVTAVVVMVLAILWSTQADRFGESIIHTVNSVGAMIAPSITTVFLFGIFWKRGTREAATYTFSIGLILGFFQFIMDIPLIGNVRVLTDGLGISFMMQTWWVFVISSVIFVTVSYLTPKPTEKQISYVIDVKGYVSGKIKGITDFRIIGISVFVLLIVLWGVLEIIGR